MPDRFVARNGFVIDTGNGDRIVATCYVHSEAALIASLLNQAGERGDWR